MCSPAHFVVSYYFPSLAHENLKKAQYQLLPSFYLTDRLNSATKNSRGWKETAYRIVLLLIFVLPAIVGDILFVYPVQLVLGNGYAYYKNLCIKRVFKKFEMRKDPIIKKMKLFSFPIYIGSALITHPLSIPAVFIGSIHMLLPYL